ncbi:MAG: 16S rRNA (cytosine(1402)-N(4))-methyltransferase RsmH [Burkholderiales bacterium]|nr:16S rRNA (cytosine(1402)-N(4))-methyltransferase RsmH [Burkholderiales bacterium]
MSGPASLTFQHQTVLASAAVVHLVPDASAASGIYVDGTFGRGGHSRLILERLAPQGRLIALDRDPQAAAAAQAIADPRFRFAHARFSRMTSTLADMGVTRVNGILLDIGVSSPQIDDPARGFSLRAAGPLDMRMDTTSGITAAEWLATATLDELVRVIRDYGEERFALPIAKALVARRAHGADGRAARPLATTADLAALVADAVPKRRKTVKGGGQHPATRTFQAVRIHVNQELEELALALDQSLQLLAAGGRLAVISFHSLEDRIVKRFIEAHAHPERMLERLDPRLRRLPLSPAQLPQPSLRALARLRPDDAEVAANPRARSAVLRVAERTEATLPEAA